MPPPINNRPPNVPKTAPYTFPLLSFSSSSSNYFYSSETHLNLLQTWSVHWLSVIQSL